ncbi:unnamed protein product [Amoebophrya sp. A120]|nr:unnamed protein product [Amoebophrya sp. A120]|eukprot:GSA120T00009503001.1
MAAKDVREWRDERKVDYWGRYTNTNPGASPDATETGFAVPTVARAWLQELCRQSVLEEDALMRLCSTAGTYSSSSTTFPKERSNDQHISQSPGRDFSSCASSFLLVRRLSVHLNADLVPTRAAATCEESESSPSTHSNMEDSDSGREGLDNEMTRHTRAGRAAKMYYYAQDEQEQGTDAYEQIQTSCQISQFQSIFATPDEHQDVESQSDDEKTPNAAPESDDQQNLFAQAATLIAKVTTGTTSTNKSYLKYVFEHAREFYKRKKPLLLFQATFEDKERSRTSKRSGKTTEIDGHGVKKSDNKGLGQQREQSGNALEEATSTSKSGSRRRGGKKKTQTLEFSSGNKNWLRFSVEVLISEKVEGFGGATSPGASSEDLLHRSLQLLFDQVSQRFEAKLLEHISHVVLRKTASRHFHYCSAASSRATGTGAAVSSTSAYATRSAVRNAGSNFKNAWSLLTKDGDPTWNSNHHRAEATAIFGVADPFTGKKQKTASSTKVRMKRAEPSGSSCDVTASRPGTTALETSCEDDRTIGGKVLNFAEDVLADPTCFPYPKLHSVANTELLMGDRSIHAARGIRISDLKIWDHEMRPAGAAQPESSDDCGGGFSKSSSRMEHSDFDGGRSDIVNLRGGAAGGAISWPPSTTNMPTLLTTKTSLEEHQNQKVQLEQKTSSVWSSGVATQYKMRNTRNTRKRAAEEQEQAQQAATVEAERMRIEEQQKLLQHGVEEELVLHAACLVPPLIEQMQHIGDVLRQKKESAFSVKISSCSTGTGAAGQKEDLQEDSFVDPIGEISLLAASDFDQGMRTPTNVAEQISKILRDITLADFDKAVEKYVEYSDEREILRRILAWELAMYKDEYYGGKVRI